MISNPFNWTAGPFLTLYLSFAVIVFLLGARLRSRIGPAALASHQLNVLELAYLSGGARRVGDAALLSLTSASVRGHHARRSITNSFSPWHSQAPSYYRALPTRQFMPPRRR